MSQTQPPLGGGTRSGQKALSRILFVAPLSTTVTGQSLASQILFDELAARHDVQLVNLSKGTLKQGISSFGRVVEVLQILYEVWRGRSTADLVYFTVSESGAGNAKDLLVFALCHRRLSRMVVHLHGGAGLRLIMQGKRGLRRRLNEYFARRLGGAIVLGDRHVPIYAAAMDRSRIHVVPNFAEDYLFADVAEIDAKFRSCQPLRVLYLSNLLPGKGYEELLDAIELLAPEQRAAVRVDMAGGFQSEQERVAFLRRIQGLPEVTFHGAVHGAKKRELLQAAHLFCLPTYYPYEGQPISILEAYASGCAVVTTDHSGIFDVFTPGTNGLEVQPRSAASLASALGDAVSAPHRLREMAFANRKAADAEYRATSHLSKLRHVLDSVMSSESSVPPSRQHSHGNLTA